MAPKPNEFILHSRALPALKAGRYRARLTQTVSQGGPIAAVERHLVLTAPRFTLPPGDIKSVFPPANAEGAFEARLAQVVLGRRTLPWERELTPGDSQQRPWLALVLLTDSEGTLVQGQPVTTAVPAAQHGALEITAASGLCDRLDTTPAVVSAVFPRPDELELLCHVREVSLEDTELASGDDDGFLSVVLCARLPRSGVTYNAFLVSLEHRLAALPTSTGTPGTDLGPTEVANPGTGTVSFPVLAHWRFRCTGQGDFQSLMQTLDAGLLGTAPRGCPAVSPTGHVVVAHRTRRGEEVAAWYRGPLTLLEVLRRSAGQPYFAADQARAIAQDGLEDLSEAAAFELGRLLAMSSPRFLAEVLTWRRETLATDTVATALTRVPGLTQLGLNHLNVQQGLGLAVIDQLTRREDPLGPRVPLSDVEWLSDRFPLTLIAEGFGIDPEELRRLLLGGDLGPNPMPPRPVQLLEHDFDRLRGNPDLLRPLRAALSNHLLALAAGAGIDPLTGGFDPSFAPTTLDALFGRGPP